MSGNKSVKSLYLCDFPKTLERLDIHQAFHQFDGYIEARVARDKTGQKISFVDFSTDISAKEAMSSMKGFKFKGASRGLNIRFSDNSCNNWNQSRPNDRYNNASANDRYNERYDRNGQRD